MSEVSRNSFGGSFDASVGNPVGSPFDVLAVGRIGIDLRPAPADSTKPLADVSLFTRSLGGSPTAVAVAAARHGLSAGLVTKVGADPFGAYARGALRGFGVDDRYVGTDKDSPTPVAFVEAHSPDQYSVHSYRTPTTPDLRIRPEELDSAAIESAGILWLSGTGLCREPSRSTHLAALATRVAAGPRPGLEGRRRLTVFDLDYHAGYWPSALSARAAYAEVLPHASVVIGDREEVEIAVGHRDPEEAAYALLEAGARLAIVKLGLDGVLARDRRTRVAVPAMRLPVIDMVGADDAFGGALCYGLLQDWPLERTMRFAAAAGGLVASRAGSTEVMPTLEETEKALAAGGD